MIQSGGIFKRPDILRWHGNTQTLTDSVYNQLGLGYSYGAMYRNQPWVYVPVNKIASATARLPMKVYRRDDEGRSDARDTPYWRLLNQPNPRIAKVTFWRWVRSTWDIYGETFLGKVRDAGGRPVQLVPLHPMYMKLDENTGTWKYDDGKRSIDMPRRDFVWFRHFNPDGPRGLSPLEPLRSTLENEWGARQANSTMWANGGRPSVVLSHPQTLTEPAAARIAASWQAVHGGVENWGKAAVLEEGLTATVLPVNVEELQYIEARKINREESCAVYDIPPPALHILDHATFSNVVENLRSMYRDTMAPKNGDLESTLEWELRDGRMGADVEPDFPDDLYAEMLMDEVLRGDFEVRTEALRNADYMTIAEKRRIENLPYIEGTDRIFINSASLPLTDEGTLEQPVEQLALPAGPDTRSLMGKLSRVKSLVDVDPQAFTTDARVAAELTAAVEAGHTVDQFKQRLRELVCCTPRSCLPLSKR